MSIWITGDDGKLREITSEEWEDRQRARKEVWEAAQTKARNVIDDLTDTELWAFRQALANPAHYYGDGGTIHSSTDLDVEVYEDRVVSVWFRCMRLPFKQARVDKERGIAMSSNPTKSKLFGVEVTYD